VREILSYIIIFITGTLRGVNYMIASININLSMIPYLIGMVVVWLMQLVAKIFIPINESIVYIYVSDYHEMIEKIKQKKYDELYNEMKKREKQDEKL
jgi:hypothetical protein